MHLLLYQLLVKLHLDYCVELWWPNSWKDLIKPLWVHKAVTRLESLSYNGNWID